MPLTGDALDLLRKLEAWFDRQAREESARRAYCEGKERFESSAVAKQVADRPRKYSAKMFAYGPCRYCAGYHLANATKSFTARTERRNTGAVRAARKGFDA